MEEQTILGILNYLGKGAGTSFIFYMILRFLKRLHPYFETFMNYNFKHQEIKSYERIEKKKVKSVRLKNKSSN